MKQLVVLFLSLFISTLAFGQKKWTLKECVTYALENNISVKQSELDIENAEIDKIDAFGNYLPTLNGNASNFWNTGLSQNITTGILETQTSRNFSLGVNAGVRVFAGLQNLRVMQRAKIAKLAADYGLSRMKDDISLLVANSYLQILLNKANVNALKAQNLVTQQSIAQTQELVDGGILPKGDLLEIQATNAGELQNIVVAENAVRISLISLAQLLLIDDYASFDIEDEGYDLVDEGIIEKTASEIFQAATENRSEVKIAESNVDLAQKDLQIARSSYYPTINAFFNYNTRESDLSRFTQTVDPNDPTRIQEIGFVDETGQTVSAVVPNTILQELPPRSFIDQLYLNDGISYGVQMNVPIFNGFSTRNNVKRRLVNFKRQAFLLEQAKLDLESNVYQAYVDAEGSKKAYEAAVVALESQELAYQYAKDRYDVGITNAFDFSQSKLRYDNALIEVNRSKYDYIFRLKVLELYFGVPATELKF